MGIVEIVLIGIALSADAMSVTVCNMLANPMMSRSRAIAMPVLFGLFQGFMPLLGYLAGSLVASFVDMYAGIIAFVILGFIGGKMIWDGFNDDGCDECGKSGLGWWLLIVQSIATSIDAFAVGITFVSSGTPVLLNAAIITLCTFLLCCLMLFVGGKLGKLLGQKAQTVGGAILLLIGLKALLF